MMTNPFAMGGNTPFGNVAAALPMLLQGFFGDSGAPYRDAGRAYGRYYNEAKTSQNPFFNTGRNTIPKLQEWLGKMENPSDFINKLMGGYQESPYAQNLQRQVRRAAINSGSATGLVGSTPWLQQVQQNASNITSGDMNQWLQNVLGINTQYGQGLAGLYQGGQHAADILAQLASNAGEYMGGTAYGERAGEQQDQGNIWAGLTKIFGG